MKYIKDDIYTILVNAQYQPSINYVPFFQVDIVQDTSQVTFVNNQVNSLVKLYVQLSPKDKITFLKDIQSFLEVDGNDMNNIVTAYNFLIHNGQCDIAFNKITISFSSFKHNIILGKVCLLVSEILKNEWNIIPKDQINILYKWADDTLNHKNALGTNFRSMPSLFSFASLNLKELHKKLNIVKMLELNDRIFVGTNDEINTDQKALKNEFKKHNFPTDLSEALDKIDFKISTANDNFDFKGAIDLIRSFTERLFQYISITINVVEGKKVNEKDSEAVTKFFIENKLISDDQGKMIVALRHFLSNEGVHRLKSRPDDARLSRNMAVEMSLYLVLRLKDITEN